jgi:hypothetical protein
MVALRRATGPAFGVPFRAPALPAGVTPAQACNRPRLVYSSASGDNTDTGQLVAGLLIGGGGVALGAGLAVSSDTGSVQLAPGNPSPPITAPSAGPRARGLSLRAAF